MLETARWGKFLAIMAFIGMGLILLIGLAMAMFIPMLGAEYAQAAEMGGWGTGFILFYTLVIVTLYIYPAVSLYRFSKYMKLSLNTFNQEQFNTSLRNLKNIFKFVGIITIILLALYGIFFLFAILGAALS
jgi:hypothetical protein